MRPTIRTSTRALAVALLGLTAACSDASLSTAPAAPSATPRQLLGASLDATLDATLSTTRSDTVYTTFTYNPLFERNQTFAGAHNLSLPAGAVCDVLLSGYGVGTWDQGCAPLQQPITFTSKAWTDASGRPRLTFSPDVRFVPGKTVTLRMKDAEAAATLNSAIAWCPTDGTGCIDEAKADPTLVTQRGNGTVFRRLKHFSGYHIILGRACEDMSDPNCIADTGF